MKTELIFPLLLSVALLAGCNQIGAKTVEETAVFTIEPAVTPTLTNTPESTATATPTYTPTVTETAVPTPTPTIIPSPTPSLQNLSASDSVLITVPRTDFVLSGQSDPNVYDIAVSPIDKLLAVASNQGLLIFDLVTLDLIVAAEEDGSVEKSVAWSPDGTRLVVGSGPRVWIWNYETRTTEYEFSGHEVEMYHVAWSPNLPLVVSVANNGTFGVWNVETGEPSAPVQPFGMRTIQFSPNGTALLFNQGYQLFVTDFLNTTAIEFSEEHTDLVTSVSWNPEGTRFVSGSYDDSLRIWDLEQEDSIMVLEKHVDDILDVAWSPDGTYIASGSADLTTLIWDAETGEPVYRLRGHSESIRSLGWFPDGSHLVTASEDGTIRIWEIP